MFQFTIAAIVLAFALFANANVVVDIASQHSPGKNMTQDIFEEDED